MNRTSIKWMAIVLGIAALGIGAWLQHRGGVTPIANLDNQLQERLLRNDAPTFGVSSARVTIVEFFDPACEGCRAFHPYVKQILASQPADVRLVLRYAPFHQGSEEAVAILEAARAQGRFEPVLEALLEGQPRWADHQRPDVSQAWVLAEGAGLDVARARSNLSKLGVDATLKQDVADLNALGIHKTPSFYVNGTFLETVSPQALSDLVQAKLQQQK